MPGSLRKCTGWVYNWPQRAWRATQSENLREFTGSYQLHGTAQHRFDYALTEMTRSPIFRESVRNIGSTGQKRAIGIHKSCSCGSSLSDTCARLKVCPPHRRPKPASNVYRFDKFGENREFPRSFAVGTRFKSKTWTTYFAGSPVLRLATCSRAQTGYCTAQGYREEALDACPSSRSRGF